MKKKMGYFQKVKMEIGLWTLGREKIFSTTKGQIWTLGFQTKVRIWTSVIWILDFQWDLDADKTPQILGLKDSPTNTRP